jgi:Butirosin biosynthesis protein H, N-terminal/Domain of unknown function (DUF4872)
MRPNEEMIFMTVLTDYHEFDGLHWETGTLYNILSYQGVRHNGKPLSEVLLMGISGGIAAGYFTFEYEGHDPWLHFLTLFLYNGGPGRAYERLNIPKQAKQTDKPEKAAANLLNALDAGKPAIVWADMFSLPYNNLKSSEIAWGMFPVVVYGYDEKAKLVYIADRARIPLTATVDEFTTARTRIRANKNRLMTIGAPDLSKLPDAIKAGIEECVSGFIDDAPKAPMKGKYGLDAFTKWANLLVDKKGWAKQFPPGIKMYAVLKSAFQYTHLWYTGGCGGRGVYADFLDEAAGILSKPALKDVATQYRAAAKLWDDLNHALLPDEVALFKETRELMTRSSSLFREQGAASLPERQQISARLDAIRESIAADFPLTDSEATTFRENLRDHVLKIHDAEKEAVMALKDAMA